MKSTKLKKLEEIIRGYRHMLVALSGGADSTFLLAFAYEVLAREEKKGGEPAAERMAAVSATGPQFKKDETDFAVKMCDGMGIAHKKVDVSHIVEIISSSPADRCYHCKKEMFGILKERAEMTGSVLCDGTNADDLTDYRPGYKAALELGVKSPLLEAGLTKEEIRLAMREMDTAAARADYPASACLASRIPYGETISREKLEAIERAEGFLGDRGFTQLRVRCHEAGGSLAGGETRLMARIELIDSEKDRFLGMMDETDRALRNMGFEYVTLDLGTYEKGRMNIY